MLLHELSRKFQMGKLKSSLLWLCFVLNWASVSISRCNSGYEADLSGSVISFISSTMEQMRSTVTKLEIT
jgi:hypothetical protein